MTIKKDVDTTKKVLFEDFMMIRMSKALKTAIECRATALKRSASAWARICLEVAHGWPPPEDMRPKGKQDEDED